MPQCIKTCGTSDPDNFRIDYVLSGNFFHLEFINSVSQSLSLLAMYVPPLEEAKLFARLYMHRKPMAPHFHCPTRYTGPRA